MIDSLHRLIASLREELQHYGEMLALLDRQQDLVMHRNAEDLFLSVADVQRQAVAIHESRSLRDGCRRELAQVLGRPGDSGLLALVPFVPADYQPLLEALVQENNQLLFRVQQRARQNHLLLSRSLDLMQRFLGTLFPARETLVYNEQGSRQVYNLPARPIYEAVG